MKTHSLHVSPEHHVSTRLPRTFMWRYTSIVIHTQICSTMRRVSTDDEPFLHVSPNYDVDRRNRCDSILRPLTRLCALAASPYSSISILILDTPQGTDWLRDMMRQRLSQSMREEFPPSSDGFSACPAVLARRSGSRVCSCSGVCCSKRRAAEAAFRAGSGLCHHTAAGAGHVH